MVEPSNEEAKESSRPKLHKFHVIKDNEHEKKLEYK